MALQSSWIEHLFGRLTMRYGAAFLRQWQDADPVLVREDWANVLDGTGGESISYALDNLPSERPLNAMQFRDLCRRWPGPKLAALAAPAEQADPKRVAAALQAMQRPKAQHKSMAQECIDNIERLCNGKPSSAQKHMVAHCLRMPGTSTKLPIEAAAL